MHPGAGIEPPEPPRAHISPLSEEEGEGGDKYPRPPSSFVYGACSGLIGAGFVRPSSARTARPGDLGSAVRGSSRRLP
mgnify:CR=1 FL=1